ncbi:hypothetical protein ACFX19_000063 [Malus domestica]
MTDREEKRAVQAGGIKEAKGRGDRQGETARGKGAESCLRQREKQGSRELPWQVRTLQRRSEGKGSERLRGEKLVREIQASFGSGRGERD